MTCFDMNYIVNVGEKSDERILEGIESGDSRLSPFINYTNTICRETLWFASCKEYSLFSSLAFFMGEEIADENCCAYLAIDNEIDTNKILKFDDITFRGHPKIMPKFPIILRDRSTVTKFCRDTDPVYLSVFSYIFANDFHNFDFIYPTIEETLLKSRTSFLNKMYIALGFTFDCIYGMDYLLENNDYGITGLMSLVLKMLRKENHSRMAKKILEKWNYCNYISDDDTKIMLEKIGDMCYADRISL